MRRVITFTSLAFAASSHRQFVAVSTNPYAWSENAGWINFAPRATLIDPVAIEDQPYFGAVVDDGFGIKRGVAAGFAWAENLGWFNLDACNTGQFVFVRCLADVNEDTRTTPADFNAWIINYNECVVVES